MTAHRLLVLAIFAVALVRAVPAFPAEVPASRVLVLGFASLNLSDLQDRLLRETILRELLGRGYAIVPVMQIESLFQDETPGRIRQLKREEVRAFCRNAGARFAITGTMKPRRADRAGGLKKGDIVDCRFILYNRDKDSFLTVKFEAVGRETLLESYSDIAGKTVSALEPHLIK